MDKEELKIKELIAERGHYFSMIMLISSGVAGLLIANLPLWKFISLMLFGLYFDIVFILKYTSVDDELKSNLKETK